MALLLVPYTDDEDATWLEYARNVVNYSFDFKGIVINLTFDILKVPDFGIPSLDASYLLSMGIFIVTIFLAYFRKLFVMCLGLPIFNMANSKPGQIQRGVMRVFSLSSFYLAWRPMSGLEQGFSAVASDVVQVFVGIRNGWGITSLWEKIFAVP